MTIRPARHEDCAEIARLGLIFHAEAGWSDIADYVEEDCLRSLMHLVEAEAGILIVLERHGEIIGFAGGMASPIYFNFAHKTGQEFFYWIRPEARGRHGIALLDALEEAARTIGCNSWVMISLAKLNAESTGRFFERRGYRPSENTFIKRL